MLPELGHILYPPLAILGLGCFEGITKGVDKLGINSLIENATGSATEMYKSLSFHILLVKTFNFLGRYHLCSIVTRRSHFSNSKDLVP